MLSAFFLGRPTTNPLIEKHGHYFPESLILALETFMGAEEAMTNLDITYARLQSSTFEFKPITYHAHKYYCLVEDEYRHDYYKVLEVLETMKRIQGTPAAIVFDQDFDEVYRGWS